MQISSAYSPSAFSTPTLRRCHACTTSHFYTPIKLRSVAPSWLTYRRKNYNSFARSAVAEAPSQPGLYFVATNNFKVKEEHASAFEEVWKNRESHLNESPGFIRFALLRGDAPGEYVSQTFWASRRDFEAWTQSRQFRQAHGSQEAGNEAAGSEKPKPSMAEMLDGRPQAKLYEAVTVTEASLI